MWSANGDSISKIYAGTGALDGKAKVHKHTGHAKYTEMFTFRVRCFLTVIGLHDSCIIMHWNWSCSLKIGKDHSLICHLYNTYNTKTEFHIIVG